MPRDTKRLHRVQRNDTKQTLENCSVLIICRQDEATTNGLILRAVILVCVYRNRAQAYIV